MCKRRNLMLFHLAGKFYRIVGRTAGRAVGHAHICRLQCRHVRNDIFVVGKLRPLFGWKQLTGNRNLIGL